MPELPPAASTVNRINILPSCEGGEEDGEGARCVDQLVPRLGVRVRRYDAGWTERAVELAVRMSRVLVTPGIVLTPLVTICADPETRIPDGDIRLGHMQAVVIQARFAAPIGKTRCNGQDAHVVVRIDIEYRRIPQDRVVLERALERRNHPKPAESPNPMISVLVSALIPPGIEGDVTGLKNCIFIAICAPTLLA